jgi:hypothetical protein
MPLLSSNACVNEFSIQRLPGNTSSDARERSTEQPDVGADRNRLTNTPGIAIGAAHQPQHLTAFILSGRLTGRHVDGEARTEARAGRSHSMAEVVEKCGVIAR